MTNLNVEDWQAILLTLKLAFASTLILLVIATPLAWWLSDAKHQTIKTAIQAIVALPLVLPPTVLGFYLLILLMNINFDLTSMLCINLQNYLIPIVYDIMSLRLLTKPHQ